jgi:acetyl-CoA carboxylase alpha subunit
MTAKIPKTLAACADRVYAIKAEKANISKKLEALQEEESILREHLIDNLPKSEATGVAGKVARATVKNKVVPQVKDWDALYGHIVKSYKKNPGVFSLLQRRVGEAAVKEIWDSGKEVPGVSASQVPVLSVVKA